MRADTILGTVDDRDALHQAGMRAFARFHIDILESTTSTQDVVRAAAIRGAAPGYACITREQSRGRGRQDRRWEAPPGSALLASILVRAAPAHLGWVPLVAGLALRSAIARESGYEARLKWPNDVLAGPAKLAGVLAEVEGRAPSGGGVAVAVGTGVNLRVASFPAGIQGASLHRFTSRVPRPAPLFAAYLTELSARLDQLAGDGGEAAAEEWTRHAAGLGSPVTVSTSGTVLHGVASGLDRDGALLVSSDSGTARVLAGDVHIGLPPAD